MTACGATQRNVDAARKRVAEVTDPEERRALQTEISLLETWKAVEMETFKRHS